MICRPATWLFITGILFAFLGPTAPQETVDQFLPHDADNFDDLSDPPIHVYVDWPTAITCYAVDGPDYENEYYEDDYPTSEQQIQCTIEINDETVFNETMLWGEAHLNGLYKVVPEDWSDTSISFTVGWIDELGEEQYLTRETTIQAMPPECDPAAETLIIGGDKSIQCDGHAPFLHLTAEQFGKIEPVFYKDDVKISKDDIRYQFIPHEYEESVSEYRTFGELKIRNASATWTPGLYNCMLEFNGLSLCASQKSICVEKEYEYANEPSIIAAEEFPVVQPGSDVVLKCIGQTGSNSQSSSQVVKWTKDGKDLCVAGISTQSNANCTFEIHRNLRYCDTLSPEEAAHISDARLDDNFTTTFTIRNATWNDAGVYTCIFSATKGTENTTITLDVELKPDTHSKLTIALIVVGVFVAIALKILILAHVFYLRVRFYYKKVRGKYHEIPHNGYVAYFLYARDSFANQPKNPVEDITNWFRDMRYPLHDPNREDGNNNEKLIAGGSSTGTENVNDNDAGKLAVDHLVDLLSRCMSMVIIITESLLNENDIEILRAYKGLNENVRRNLKIVFVCSSQIEKEIKRRAKGECDLKKGNETCRTFNRFMKMPQNRVVRWKPNQKEHLNRALYVAVPNARSRQTISTIV